MRTRRKKKRVVVTLSRSMGGGKSGKIGTGKWAVITGGCSLAEHLE